MPDCDGSGTAERSYPSPRSGAAAWRSYPTPPSPRPGAAAGRTNPTTKELWLRGHRRAERSYSTFKVRRGGAEYLMKNAGLDEAQAGIKIAGRNINEVQWRERIKI